MIHLKYKCKVNFVKLPLIWIYLCLKLVFENATAGRNTGCRSVVNYARYQPTPTFPAFPVSVKSMTAPAVQMRFTRGCVRELKNDHNSVTVQNRTHVYMNFFHHKGLGNHLLQLCPKVVKHPVCVPDYNVNCHPRTLILSCNKSFVVCAWHNTICWNNG